MAMYPEIDAAKKSELMQNGIYFTILTHICKFNIEMV